ncbi:surface repeat protein, putative [Roseobacter sp. AzwK-3b]|uniref:leukotoxin LktA family filamentous adhesin n=1 Tax=Roseobacter sp. AzwK-3b TaxID=351016 RepID=UPI000156C073|nr:leukotoxin LktA family filamentous adhesin [Roseobacter sp. AzwK-3b]EDM69698.1 surface repeat protein, putative [Roseobacter sp. AzwK-3b]
MTQSKTSRKARPFDKAPRSARVLPMLRNAVGSVSILALVAGAFPLPAQAQVVAATPDTTVATAGLVSDVTTSNIRGGVAFNQFSQFNVNLGNTVNLYQPLGATALVNIISGGTSTIAGTLNARLGSPGASIIGGNTYLLNSDGFVVSSTGVINAGKLTLSTPTSGFMDQLRNEANGIGSASNILFAGNEPLSATGQIDIQGRINATRLDMRAGARMIVDGRLDVQSGISPGRISPSVNLQGVPTAGGVNIGRDGVIRLVSGGSSRVSGNASARGSLAGTAPHGGLIEVIAEGELQAGGIFDVSNGGGAAGSVMMFTEGNAILEPGLQIVARSSAAAGGFVALRANGTLTTGTTSGAGIVTDTGSPDSSGETFLVGDTVDLARSLTTEGGSLGIRGTTSVAIGNDGGTMEVSTARAGGAAGDLVISSKDIEIKPGTSLNAQGTGDGNGGLVLVSARNVSTGARWAFDPDTKVARVTITDADIAGGSVIVSAVARASSIFGDELDETLEANQVEQMEASTTDEQFEQMFDNLLNTYETVANRAITSVNELVPLQIKFLTSDARVEITDSTLTADGNWTPIGASITDPTAEFADNGFLMAEGLREDTYRFLTADSVLDSLIFDDAYQLSIRLPSEVDLSTDTLVVHSHSETETNIAPFSFAVDVAVSSTKTVSAVQITDSALLTNAGNLRLAATASENQTISITAKKAFGQNVALGVAVSVRNLANQLRVDGGSLTSAAGITAGAFTGRNVSSTVIANSGMEGEVSIGINVDYSESLTEAAIGGTITALGGDVAIAAEQLFFNSTRVTTATLGLGSLSRAVARSRANSSNSTGFAQTIQQRATGKTPDPARKPHFGMGVAVDFQLSDDNAFATLGGSYRDIDDLTVAPVALGATNVTASGAVTVNAAYRFADRGSEGGGSLTRSTSAAFGKLTDALRRQLDRENDRLRARGLAEITEDELLGRFSTALMLNLSISSLAGETLAEIGPNTIVTATSASVDALTRYPNTNPWQSLLNQWQTYVDEVTSYSPISTGGPADPPEPAAPPAPDLAGFLDIVNPLTYLTTDSKAKGEAQVAADRVVVPGEEQGLALGITLTIFNTDNVTEAVVREGAVLNLNDAASVTALQEALFLHVTNLPRSNPLGGTAKVNDAIGGGIFFSRTASDVRAEIENGAEVTVTSGDLDVTAETKNLTASLAYSGGQGADVAINASVAAHVAEAETMARIGEAARIVAQDVTITATDNSVTWASAGAITGSENVGVGASGVFNFSSRRTWAGIGPALVEAPLVLPTNPVIDADSLTITATNASVDITVAVAGTKVVGKEDPAADTTPPPNTSDDDMIIPSWLFSDEEDDAAQQQQQNPTPADANGDRQTSGWAVSGAAVVNLALQNETTASLRTTGRVNLDGALSVTAGSTATMINVGGSVASGLGSQKDTNALAGAFAVHVDERLVRARIDGATVDAGAVAIDATDAATLVNIAVGGAGTSRGDLALAGSVSVAVLSGETLSELRDVEIASESLSLNADDQSVTVSVAGAVGVNMDATQGYGVGVGIAVNTVVRDALSRITGTGTISTGVMSLMATSSQSIFGFGTTAGVGQTGLAGSITVNTISGGARALIEAGLGVRSIEADNLTVTADESNIIFALSGALAGGRSNAVGAALSVNTIVAGTEARVEGSEIAKRAAGPDLGAVQITADSDSTITAIAVAGAAALTGEAAGLGLSVNTINADSIASLAGSSVIDAANITATATGARTIRSLAGGAAAAGRAAAGAGMTVNLLPSNDTLVNLNNASLSTRNGGAITATATGEGEIASLAAGISASTADSVGGALTVNVTTATTGITATDATLDAPGAVSLSASDTATISSLAGGAALGAGGTGVGGAAAANFINHDTSVAASGGSMTGQGVSLSARNDSGIETAAVGLAAGGTNSFAGSIAIGGISNETRAAATGTRLDAGTGDVSVSAGRGGSIDILSGAAAFGGTNAVGGALSVASITGAVTADVVDTAAGGISGSSLSIDASDEAAIDAISASGVAGAGGTGVTGSLVYTQIGRVAVDGPSVDPLPGSAPGEDPLSLTETAITEARDSALSNVADNVTGRGDVSIFREQLRLELDTDDLVRARLELAGAAPTVPDVSITASQTGGTRSFAGATGAGTTGGSGAGLALNLLFGKAEAEFILPADEITTAQGDVTVTASQDGSVQTTGVSGGASGSIGGAGSISLNVMNRQADARIASSLAGDQATLLMAGHDLTLDTTQFGLISSITGAAGLGGTAGIGGAIAVNILSDDTDVELSDIRVDTRIGADLVGAGAVQLSARQDQIVGGAAAALGGGAGGTFAGSFVVNVADGAVGTTLRDSTVLADTISAAATGGADLAASAGAVAVGATGAVGLAIATNVARQTIRTDIDGSYLQAQGPILLTALAEGTLSGAGIAGALDGVAGITGTGIGDSALNTVEVLVRDTTPPVLGAVREGSQIVTAGSVLLAADASNIIRLKAGSEEDPGLNISFAGGGTAGVGASATVNTLRNDVRIAVSGNTRITGLGQTGVIRDGAERFGVVIDASADATISMLTANGAVGGIAGVAALMSLNLIEDDARIELGTGERSAQVWINAPATGLAGLLGTDTADARQDVRITANTTSTATVLTANVAVGGKAGVGAGSGTLVSRSLAGIEAREARIDAARDITLDARATTELTAVTLGLAGGFVGAAANAGVSILGAQALVDVDGATITAGRDLTLAANVDSDSTAVVGAAAGGAVGASGGVQVTVFESLSRVSVGRGETLLDSTLRAGGTMSLTAHSDMLLDGKAVSGAAGGSTLALALNVGVVTSTTLVEIGANESLRADAALTLRARDVVSITGMAGSLGVGALGGGASLDYARFAGTTRVLVGDNTRIEADPGAARLSDPAASTQNLTIEALSERRVTSSVVALGGAAFAVNAALGVIDMGARAEDTAGNRDILLNGAQDEFASDLRAEEPGLTEEERQNTAGGLMVFAGADDSRASLAAERQSISLNGPASSDSVSIRLGNDVLLETRGNLSLRADATTSVTQITGGLSVAIFGGSTSGVGVSNLSTSVGIDLGANARLRADGDVTVLANNSGIDAEDLLTANSYTLTASAGYAVGVGVVTTTVNGTSGLTFGPGAGIGGYAGGRANDVSLLATRGGTVSVDITNVSLSLAGGAGLVVSSASLLGGTNIDIADTRINAEDVTVEADDTSRVTAAGDGSSGGIGGGLNSVVATATAEATGTLTANGATIEAGTVRIANESAVSAEARANGIAAGGLAIGASVATSDMRVTLDSQIDASIRAQDIILVTGLRGDAFDTSAAYSTSASGGILAGNGAVSSAWTNHAIAARIAGTFEASNETTIVTGASDVHARADATGAAGGVLAVGRTVAQAGQNQNVALAADDRLARVDLVVDDATFTGKGVVIDTTNDSSTTVKAVSGSGGVAAGSASEAITTAATRTRASFGESAAVLFDGLETVALSTGQAQTLASLVDTTSAAALGNSGAIARGTIDSTVAATLGAGVAITADAIEITATNAVNRPEDGFNMQSGSGGVFDAAAMVSDLELAVRTDLTVDDGASLIQSGTRGSAEVFALAARNVLSVVDSLNLDAGGAIATPRGVSRIEVIASDATLTIGSADLLALDDITLRAGGDAALSAEVNANSYGLAGAATGTSAVTLNSDNRVVLQDGANVQSLGDIRIGAGYGANGIQTVDLRAETRLFNKTAIPIPSDPAADAVANTTSIIDVQEGARVVAVRDVYLFSEAGQREVLGYGRGKDLYREVLAELGTAISEAFGGDPVSLDIESGTSSDTSNDGILVNGYVRAGSRNKQILVINEDGAIQNARIGPYTNDMVDGITFSIRENVSIANEVRERIDLLNSLLADPILNQDAEAVAAWEAEVATLTLRDISGRADFLDLEDIVAAQGDIVLRADYVHGTATGTLDAPVNAEIIVHSYVRDGARARFINTKGMDIAIGDGGRIFFNDVTVTTPAEITALSDPTRPGPDSYTMISGASSGESKIEVVTFGEGSIIVGGAISNVAGLARFNSNEGDLDVRDDITARTIELRAGRDFLQGFTLGIRHVDGDPKEIYDGYFDKVEDTVRTELANTGVISASLASGLPRFELAPRRGRIQAGRNVYISADQLNVNGLIQAGRGSFDVQIDAGIDAFLDTLAGTTKLEMLYDPSEPFIVTPTGTNIVRNPNITSDVFVRFDPTALDDNGNATGAIVVNPMVVQGGVVEITGKVFSTGGGEIRSLDGFGSINVVNDSTRPVRLGRMDTGANTPAGVEGLVRITDTSRTVGGDFFITEYRRIGSELQVLDNQTFDIIDLDFDADGTTDATRINPTNLVSSITAGDGRSASYATKERQELVINRAETVVRTFENTTTAFYIIAINASGDEVESEVIETETKELDAAVLTGNSGSYIATATTDLTAPYRLTAERTENRRRVVSTVTEGTRLIGEVKETEIEEVTTTHLYSHRLKADTPIAITFDGTDTGGLTVLSLGDVQLAGAVRNQLGTTTIQSTGGSLVTTDPSIVVDVGSATFSGLGGRIGGMGSEFRVDQTPGSTLTATALTGIDLREVSGDMTVLSARTTARDSDPTRAVTGAIRLTADGAILGSGAGPHVEGSAIELISTNGTIGTDLAPLVLREEGRGLTVRSRGNVDLIDEAGDLNLREVTSSLGSVTLSVPSGLVLDANTIERRDLRTEAELLDLWSNDLGLFGDPAVAARAAEQVAALKAERERSYRAYWQDRNDAGGAPLAFTLEPATETALRADGWSDARIAAYVAERQALYDLWNADADFDPAYSHAVTAEERVAVLDGASWTREELDSWLRAGLIRGTGDTNIRVEDPNILAAGDITLNTNGIGSLLEPYVVGSDRAEDLRVLAGAERNDITTEGTRITVARRDDLNIALTSRDASGRPEGALTVGTTTGDVFLGSEVPVSVAQIDTTGDVELKVDGTIFDASPVDRAAITGRNILLESGNFAAIGTPDELLSLDILTDGSLIARGGTGVFLTTLGDAPLAELFSGGPLVLRAGGAITDIVATGAVRVRAADITLEATEIGTLAVPLVVEITDPAGALDLTTTTGDANLTAQGDLRLENARLAGGGQIAATGAFALIGVNTIVFGPTSTLSLVAPEGIDLSASTGTDIAGGTLSLGAGGEVGTSADPLQTALTGFDMTGTGTAPAPIVVQERDDLAIGTILQTVAGSDVTVTAGGALTIGTITTPADATLTAASILNGRIAAERIELSANGTPGGIGTGTRMDLTAGTLRAQSVSGDIILGLRDRDTDIETIAAGGTGEIDISAPDVILTLLAGPGMTTQGGTILLRAGGFEAFADILSRTGEIDLDATNGLSLGQNVLVDSSGGPVTLSTDALLAMAEGARVLSGGPVEVTANRLTQAANSLVDSLGGTLEVTVTNDMEQTAGSAMQSGTGTILMDVGGNLRLARIETLNATADALNLTVGGGLSIAPGQPGPQLLANADGALSVLRLGALVPVGPDGLGVALDQLDLDVTTGPVHLNERDGIDLQSVIARDGLIDIFGNGLMQVGTVRALASQPVVLTTALGDLVSDAAVISGSDIRLFALDGRIGGTAAGAFSADIPDASTLYLFGSGDVTYAETAGNLRAGFALSDQGSLDLSAPGNMTLGILGANGDLRLTASDSLTITMIGESRIDLADEVALQLVNPAVYGLREARSPRNLDLLTRNLGSVIWAGLVGAQLTLDLVGDDVDVMLHDATPADGLDLTITDAAGGLAERALIASVGAGVRPFIPEGRYFDNPRPLLTDRSRIVGSTGTLTLTTGYIRSGDVSHAGPVLIGRDIRIGNKVWFRQGTFDLLAETSYQSLSTVADTQVLAINAGVMTFDIRNDISLDTIADGFPIDGSGGTVIVLNRRLGGVDLNGGQGFAFGVGVETGILGWPQRLTSLTALRPSDRDSTPRLTSFILSDQDAEAAQP